MTGQFIIFFALLLTGYVCKKANIIDDGMNRSINSFIIKVAYPSLILGRIGNLKMAEGIFLNFIIITVFYFALLMIYGLFSFYYVKSRNFPLNDRGVMEFAIIAPNNGFMGFPIAHTFFGEIGLLYMIACNLSLNIMFFSYGLHLMNRDNKKKEKQTVMGFIKALVKLILNPKILSAIIGLIICGNNIEIPETINKYLDLVGGIASPMAMIFIGSTLAGSSLFSIIKNKIIIELSFLKLFIIPTLTLVLVIILPMDPLVKVICVISSSLPCATTVPIFAEQFGKNMDLASETLFLSTIVSLFSIPGFIAITSNLIL